LSINYQQPHHVTGGTIFICNNITVPRFISDMKPDNAENNESDNDANKSVLGGNSQVVLDICARVEIHAEPETVDHNVHKKSAAIAEDSANDNKNLLFNGNGHTRDDVAAKEARLHRLANKLKSEKGKFESFTETVIGSRSRESSRHSDDSKPSNEIVTKPLASHTTAVHKDTSLEQLPPVGGSPKKFPSRNTVLVGKTTDKIRRGEIGKTTFSALDLYLPGGGTRKKKKKKVKR
jgi:hypothetical protein